MKKFRFFPYQLLMAICLPMTFTGCEPDDEPVPADDLTRNENLNPAIGYARRLEMPALDEANTFITHTTQYNGKETITYSVEYDEQLHHSKWVAFTFYGIVNAKKWSRNNWNSTSWGGDPFQRDPALPEAACPDREDFSASGGVRGHLCASADRLYSKEANEQTFYYSNMSPMYWAFNGGIWENLEIAVRDAWAYKATFCDTLYVVKGGTIRKGECNESHNHRLPIPKHYFMALLCRKNGTYKSIGFYIEHTPTTTLSYRDCTVSIKQLEKETGIDFFCNLPDKIEEAVEASCNPSTWGL